MSDIREAFEALNKYRKAYDEMYQMLGIFLDADEGLGKPDIDEAWAAFNLAPGPVYWKAIEAALSANGGAGSRKLSALAAQLHESARCLGVAQAKEDADAKKYWDKISEAKLEAISTHPAPPSVAVPDNQELIRIIHEAIEEFEAIGDFDSEYDLIPGQFRQKLNRAMLTAAPSPDHIPDAGKVVASSWKSAKTGQHWPHIGGKYLIKLNGVLQHEIYEFDQGDDGMGSGEYFWDREDLDEAAPFNPEKDEWLPIDEAGTATPSVPENEVKAQALDDAAALLLELSDNADENECPEQGEGMRDAAQELLQMSARLRTAGDEVKK